ncbi:MAG: hypothetical protein SPJ62_16355 [Inconstantimicrobium porci]|uniref:hypothetical protein n=1 Tax=Inconstantimicrobium porci TaxID=2652291 RepID=UPI002A91B2BB|nr:hypothetical protein [Inconstantimicrobium porci]MDY5913538.1 hypothetical protein [Inconstantimicrobium porci]
MKAVKGNKVYIVDETTKQNYAKVGFDIYDDNDNVIEYGAGKKVDYNKYAELKAENSELKTENEKLKAEIETLKINSMTVDQLKAYAAEHEIDLGDATTKDAIIAKLGE